MSAPRLTFLYPAFFRQTPARIKPKRSPIRPHSRPAFSTGKRRCLDTAPNQRYGSANEPLPHLASTHPTPPRAVDLTGQIGKDTPTPQADSKGADASTKEQRGKDGAASGIGEGAESAADGAKGEGEGEARPARDLASEERPVQGPYVPPANAMETVLQMPSPATQEDDDGSRKKPPHLAAPRYVHHFDTWTLVQDLEKGGFAAPSAVELMKATRLMLSDNMDVARDALVSKSNVENETYLFKAACSELKTEITNNRKAEMEKMRAQRTQLQHEVEILNQRLDQSLKGMKEELKGLFDDRKMNVKMEQRSMESRVSLFLSLSLSLTHTHKTHTLTPKHPR
ncbi:MAG: CCDC90 family protein [Terriglobus roseus]|nr:CCDC90 family protein [Terriglobus roseus]